MPANKYEAAKMLQETGLIKDDGTTDTNAANKLNKMIRKYQVVRKQSETAGWGFGREAHTRPGSTTDHDIPVESWVRMHCPWYYQFEGTLQGFGRVFDVNSHKSKII